MTFGDERVTREILGNVPGWLAVTFYALAALSCLGAFLGFRRRWRSYRNSPRGDAGSPSASLVDSGPGPGWTERVRRVVRYLAFHEQLRRDPYAGWSHLLVVYGFFILFVKERQNLHAEKIETSRTRRRPRLASSPDVPRRRGPFP